MIEDLGIGKMNRWLLLTTLCFCLIFSLPGFAGEAVPEPGFSSFEHGGATARPVLDEPEISSIEDLYPLLREAIFSASRQSGDNPGDPLLESILSCSLTGQPRIEITRSGPRFSISDPVYSQEITDPRFTVPLSRFVDLLELHLNREQPPRQITTTLLVLGGNSLVRVELTATDTTRHISTDPGYPFSGFQETSSTAPRSRNMLGYLVGSTSGSSYTTVTQHAKQLNFISPAWFWLDHDKPGLFKKDPNFGTVSDAQMQEIVEKSHQNGIQVLALFHNLTNNPPSARDLLHRVLSEPALRSACINDIAATIEKFNFDGVNMDFEMIHLQDRDGYSEFMRLLQKRLKTMGKLTTIAVPAKFSDTVNSWNGQFDYEKLGQYSDIVMVMTYNENGKWSKAGPVASLPWVEKAMKYAVSKIPSEKVMMGFPTYGYDWTEGGSCKSLSCRSAADLLAGHNATLKWHTFYASPWFEYTDSGNRKHTVWFENKASLEMKFSLLKKYNLNGAGMWRLGMETDDFWEIVNR